MIRSNWLFNAAVGVILSTLFVYAVYSPQQSIAQEAGDQSLVRIHGTEFVNYRGLLAEELNRPLSDIQLPPTCTLPVTAGSRHLEQIATGSKSYAGLSTAPKISNIDVIYSGAWTPEAQEAFEFALSIWERSIASSVTIVIDAEFSALNPNVLGAAGPVNYFSGAALPLSNTFYPVALANSLVGFDIDPDSADISVTLNSQFNWYYGTDGNTPFNQSDFVSVVLHEVGHGLGFSGSMVSNGVFSGYGAQGASGTFEPFIYDRFTQDSNGRALITYPNPSIELTSALESNALFFSGSNTNSVNGNSRAGLYAPSSWVQGSSYSHLSESFNDTPNSLMTFSLGSGDSELYPGFVTLGLFRDMGWGTITEPIFDPPSVLVEVNQSLNDAYSLEDYAFDAADPETATFSIVSSSQANAGVSIDGNNNLDINPSAGWTGNANVILQMTNAIGQTETDTISVKVLSDIQTIYAPFINE